MRSVPEDTGSVESDERSGVRRAGRWTESGPTRRLGREKAKNELGNEPITVCLRGPAARRASRCGGKAGDIVGGRYRLEGIAGQGGMGVVWRALDLESGATIALKLHNRRHAERLRLVQEAELLGSLSHHALVGYVAHGVRDEAPWLAMEWLEGEDLGARLARRKLSVDETIAIGRRVAGALATVHAHGVVHCDVKPGNVFLRGGAADGATLLDLGVAWASEREELGSGGHNMVGTAGYMAPEQITAERDVDARADLFALGVMLYECLVGRGPFASRYMMEALRRTVQDPPPALCSVRGDVPPALGALVDALLARDPDQRPPSAAWVALQLDALAARGDGRPAPATLAATG